MHASFVFETAPFKAAHASTIAETPRGLVSAWFAGTREGHRDVGIWLARHRRGAWSEPSLVASGIAEDGARRYPCWNPVLYQVPDGPLLLFFKVGPSPSRWWGISMRSDDDGASWTPPRRLPDGILGPIKNKPILLDDGLLICPSSSEEAGWRTHLETTPDFGITWQRREALNDGRRFAAIQPTILSYGKDRCQILCRTRQGAIAECRSSDGGRSWSPMRPTSLPNPDSGIDAVTLADGRALLVYNHAPTRRTPLNIAVSDDGEEWQAVHTLEADDGEFSYPAVIQASDGKVHITYTWNRLSIRHVVLDPEQMQPVAMPQGLWPA
jgi:predicted neuraminidase